MVNCIQCGAHVSLNEVRVTKYGRAPVCSEECMGIINYSKTDLNDLQQLHFDQYRQSQLVKKK